MQKGRRGILSRKDPLRMAQAGFPLTLDGGYRCGIIRDRGTGLPAFTFACRCTDCPQPTGSAFSTGLVIGANSFVVVGGAPRVWTRTADSGKPSHQCWCGTCHGWTHAIAEGSPGMIVVRAGTLDNPDRVRPVGQIFLRSATRGLGCRPRSIAKRSSRTLAHREVHSHVATSARSRLNNIAEAAACVATAGGFVTSAPARFQQRRP